MHSKRALGKKLTLTFAKWLKNIILDQLVNKIVIRKRDDYWNTFWSYVYQMEISLRYKIKRDGSFQ
jgi:hypothetical protein